MGGSPNDEDEQDGQNDSEMEKQYLEIYNKMIKSKVNQQNKGVHVCTMAGCDKQFSSRFCLKRHFITIHCRVKKYVCEVCNRPFAQKQYLVEHMNVHTQYHPYECEVEGCHMKFKQRSRLCRHRKEDHGIFADYRGKEIRNPNQEQNQISFNNSGSPFKVSNTKNGAPNDKGASKNNNQTKQHP